MVKKPSEDVRISFPKWFFFPFTLGGIIIAWALIFYMVRLVQSEAYVLDILNVALLSTTLLAGILFFWKVLFYSVTATERGLETDNIIGSNKMFLWDDIVEVRRPRFDIPKDASYVISKSKDKILLVRSMKRYKELVEMIKDRAPNLKRCES